MGQFTLKTGQIILVDDADLPLVARFTWHICCGYVKHSYRDENNKVRSVYIHQLILPGCRMVDHKNRNKQDNQRHNLRPATGAQNQANTLHRGITFNGHSWIARIGRNPRRYLGSFTSEEAAAQAYQDAKLNTFGHFAPTLKQ